LPTSTAVVFHGYHMLQVGATRIEEEEEEEEGVQQ
jgi:hypothetical protein